MPSAIPITPRQAFVDSWCEILRIFRCSEIRGRPPSSKAPVHYLMWRTLRATIVSLTLNLTVRVMSSYLSISAQLPVESQ